MAENPKYVFMFMIPTAKRGKKKQLEIFHKLYDKPEVGYVCFAREKPHPEDVKEWEVRKELGQNPKNPFDHYHLLIQLTEKKRRSQVQEWLGGKYHEEPKVWSIEGARHYIMKGICGIKDCDHTFKRHGDKKCCDFRTEKYPSYSGEYGKLVKERSNSRKMAELMEIIEESDTWKQVLNEAEPSTLKGCMTYAKEVFYSKPRKEMDLKLRDWQKVVFDELMKPPNDRTIYFIVDQEGNTGKSKLAKYLVQNHEAIMLDGSNGNDMLYAYAGERIIVVNVPRGGGLDYSALEQLKDGLYFTGKYESKCVSRDYEIAVIVMLNDFPAWDSLSHDRWHGWLLTTEQGLKPSNTFRPVWNNGIPDLKLLSEYHSQKGFIERYEKAQEPTKENGFIQD